MTKWFLMFVACAALVACAPSTPAARIAANPSAYEALTPRQQELVSQGKIDTGMPPAAVRLAWGNPSRQYEGFDGQNSSQVWEYDSLRPVYTTGFYGGWGYPGYPYMGHYYNPFYYGYAPQVEYIPQRNATVWFQRERVQRWQQLR